MAKRKQKPQGSSLRMLSMAYAAGRLDRETYLRLRTRQLGALEFGKPLPDIPEDLWDITIPTVKIDASYLGAKKRNKTGFLVALIAIIVLSAIGTGTWFAMNRPAPAPARADKQLTAEDYAHRLLQSVEWSERDMTAFTRLWAARSTAAKNRARQRDWYLALENGVIKRINRVKRRIDETANAAQHGRQLERLRIFQAQLTSD